MIANILMLAALLFCGGVIFVSVGMAIVKAFDLLESKYDE